MKESRCYVLSDYITVNFSRQIHDYLVQHHDELKMHSQKPEQAGNK